MCKYIAVHDEEENLKQSVGVLLFVDKHKDGAKMDVVSNHLPGNCSNRNFFSIINMMVIESREEIYLEQFEELSIFFDNPDMLFNLVTHL